MLWLYSHNNTTNNSENKEGEGAGSESSIGIIGFNSTIIKVGQPIPSFTVEVASTGLTRELCSSKPNVYVGKVSSKSLLESDFIGTSYDFKIPVDGHLTSSCVFGGSKYTTIWIANTTTASLPLDSANATNNQYGVTASNIPIVLKETGTYAIVADAGLRHPAAIRFDVIE